MIQESIFRTPPHFGAWNVLTGPNGSGKSRYLGRLAEDLIDKIHSSKESQYSKLVCLSGTVFERFPRTAYEININKSIIYLGHKTNHNMFSAISPFRRLVLEILRSSLHEPIRFDAAYNLLEGLGLQGRMRIRFRQKKNAKEKQLTSSSSDINIDFFLISIKNINLWSILSENISNEKIYISDILFVKNGQEISITDLSSGERGYILAGLAFCFCSGENSLILFDEPENSLHPEWQSRIIQDLNGILLSLGVTTTVVIATHSPLITASIFNDNSYICDMRADKVWKTLNTFGMNADTILLEQFGLRSARSAQAIDIIQKCLTLIANGQEETDEFSAASEEFLKLDLQLAESDPLFKTVRTIKIIVEAKN